MTPVVHLVSRTAEVALGIRDYVRDDADGVLYINCGVGAGHRWTIRRIVVQRLADGTFDVVDQVVTDRGCNVPWKVEVVAERHRVKARYLDLKLRELARARERAANAA